MINKKSIVIILASLLFCESLYLWEDIFDIVEFFFCIEIFKNDYLNNTLYYLPLFLSKYFIKVFFMSYFAY